MARPNDIDGPSLSLEQQRWTIDAVCNTHQARREGTACPTSHSFVVRVVRRITVVVVLLNARNSLLPRRRGDPMDLFSLEGKVALVTGAGCLAK